MNLFRRFKSAAHCLFSPSIEAVLQAEEQRLHLQLYDAMLVRFEAEAVHEAIAAKLRHTMKLKAAFALIEKGEAKMTFVTGEDLQKELVKRAPGSGSVQ